MNKGLNKIHAAVATLCVSCGIAFGAAPAFAGPPDKAPAAAPAPQQPKFDRQPAPERGFDRRDEQRRILQDQGAQNDAFRRTGRLTADERRDLRRQINEAGQDIYREAPKRQQ
jgi:hypothetical protein